MSPLPIRFFSCTVLLYLTVILIVPVRAEDSPPLIPEVAPWFLKHVPYANNMKEMISKGWHLGSYLDLGYNLNFNQPENGTWRSKGTTLEVNNPRVNLVLGYLRKDTTAQSRWGLEFGVQGGIDTNKLVPESPPKANEPIGSADTLRHFYRANASYLFPLGNGFQVTGGLMNSYIGYESYEAIKNPNYTRGYLLDNVPYFLFGAEALYPFNDNLTLRFFSVNGYNYLANPNDQFSYGLQTSWKPAPKLTLTQNLYYGADQEKTNVKFWRFLSDSILEWKSNKILLAVAYDVGTEKQAEQDGHPRFVWMGSALWARWQVDGPWSLAVRPEFYWDPQGLITGAEQLIQAYTATMEYKLSFFTFNTGVAKLEYRYDRSTGSGGGFFKGADNRLVPNQHQVLFGLMWDFSV